jgi:hypothetical protein
MQSAHKGTPQILIIISGKINPYYDAIGYRIAQALRNIGYAVLVQTVDTYRPAEYSLTMLVSAFNVAWTFGAQNRQRESDLAKGIQWLQALRARTGRLYSVLAECIETPWFQNEQQICEAVGIDHLLDLGFYDQSAYRPEIAIRGYVFIFNGLNENERAKVEMKRLENTERPICWALVGNLHQSRVRLAQSLVKNFSKSGFVYLSQESPVFKGGSYLDEPKLQRVLMHTQYYIWTAHHPFFYMESERFRDAAIAGCVPFKFQNTAGIRFPERLPFLTFVGEQILLDYTQARQVFLDKYLSMPTLEEELLRIRSELL